MSALDALLRRVNAVLSAGANLVPPNVAPFGVNLASGFTVTWNSTTGNLDVSVGGGGAVAEVLTPITSAATLNSSNVGTRFLVDTSGGAFTQALPANPQDGWWYEWTDATGSWVTGGAKNLTINGGAINVQDPNYIGIKWQLGATCVFSTLGATFRTTYSLAKNLWLTR